MWVHVDHKGYIKSQVICTILSVIRNCDQTCIDHETARIYSSKMLKLAVVLVLTVIYRDVLGQDFQCYPNQTIHFTNPDNSIYTHFTAFYDVGGTRTNCTGSADSTKTNIFFECASTTATLTAYFSDRTLSEDFILDGTALSYTFVCGALSNYNEMISEDLAVSINQTDESDTPTYNITAGFFSSPGVEVTSAEVGEIVYFVITGPAEYDLLPLECNATGTGGEYKTVTTNGDHVKDEYNAVYKKADSLMQENVVQTGTLETDYNSTLYVFKFYNSNSNTLTITCNVKVCVTGICPITCALGQKRRAIGDSHLPVGDDVKTASIGKRLTIIDRALGGSGQTCGSVILTIVVSMVIGLTKM